MSIIAFILSLFSALLSFLQGGCGGCAGSIGSHLSENLGYHRESSEMSVLAGAGFFVVIASFIGIAGSILAIQRKKSAFITLLVSSVMCGLAFLGGFKDAIFYGIMYLVAAICAKVGYNNTESKLTTLLKTPQQDTDNQNTIYAVNLTKREVPNVESQKTYEPVIGLKTDALIKRAFLFLEDGEIYNAERYIEQALNQDPENPQVYMAKLMLEHRVKSPVELLSELSTPLENENLFQRALRFADGEYKSQLEGLAQSNRNKLAQARLAKEAELEQIRLKQEAEKENLYQKVLNLKRLVSTISDFEQLLQLINSLRPYKDTDDIYNEVKQAFQKEKYYQEAVQNWQKAKTSYEIQTVIHRLDKLKGYKGADELLSGAREALVEAEKKQRKKIIVVVSVVCLVIISVIIKGLYNNAKREEAARLEEQARIQREQEVQSTYTEAEEYFKAKNYSQAFEKYQILANQGYAPAQHKLGWLYQNGWGTQRDYSQAMQWYSRAADQGHAGAQSGIGMLYEEGLGVTKDLREALRWYKISASNGSKSAPEHVSLVERMIFNENTRDTLITNRNDIPIPATIFGNKVNLRTSPRIKAKSVKQLNAGHPVSISRLSDENDGMWCFVKTASGSEGWIKSDYLALSNNISRTAQERINRKYHLPANGVVANILTPGDKLNIRNIPSLNAPKILAQIELGEQVQVLEIFAESERDWYRIRCETMIYLPEEETDYDAEIEGWVNGRYINIR